MSLKTIKNGDRAEKAGEDCSGTSSSENPACDDRSSDSTSSNSQILSRSMARRLKKKMKAAKEKKLEVPKAQVEMFRDVKKSMFRSNGMKSKQASSNTVPDDTASASNCIGSGHVVLTDSPPGRVTPASVPPPASACHGRNRESKSELAKLQKGCPCDGQTLKANGSVSVDGVKKDTGEEPSKDIKASGEGKKKKKRKGKGKAKRSQIEIEGPLADGEISDAKVQRKLEGRVGSTAADHVTTNKHVPQQCLNNQVSPSASFGRPSGGIPNDKGEAASTPMAPRELKAQATQAEARGYCEETIFEKRGIRFGHLSEPSTVVCHGQHNPLHLDNGYYEYSAPHAPATFADSWYQYPAPYAQQPCYQPIQYAPPTPSHDGYQYPIPTHGEYYPPYNAVIYSCDIPHIRDWTEQRPERPDHQRDFHPEEINLASNNPVSSHREAMHECQRPVFAHNSPNMDHGVLNSDIQITDVETDDDELVLSDEEEQEIEPVADYLLRMLKTGWCSDFQINLHSRRDGRPCLVFSLHSTLAWRNLHLRNMIKLFDREKLPKIMNIAAGEYFLCPRAFDQAIQTLYGGGLVSGAQLTSPGLLVGQWEPADPTAKMDFALSYLSAGAFLRDRAIMHRAIHLISQVLNWNTVESLVRFGLYSSKFTIVCTDGVAQNISEIDSSESDSIVAGGYYPRYARYWTPQQNDASASDLTLNRDLVHFWAPRFLQSALQYVAVDFPADFKFDPTARSTIMPDRLKWPVVDGVRVAESNPAKESNETKSRVASALFVSLPFKCLRKLFKFMTKAGTMDPSTAREVVAARESRRKSTLQELDLVETEDRHLSLASEVPLGWEESVKCEEEGTRKVISMKRKWVGNDSSPPVRDGLVH